MFGVFDCDIFPVFICLDDEATNCFLGHYIRHPKIKGMRFVEK